MFQNKNNESNSQFLQSLFQTSLDEPDFQLEEVSVGPRSVTLTAYAS